MVQTSRKERPVFSQARGKSTVGIRDTILHERSDFWRTTMEFQLTAERLTRTQCRQRRLLNRAVGFQIVMAARRPRRLHCSKKGQGGRERISVQVKVTVPKTRLPSTSWHRKYHFTEQSEQS